MLSTLLPYLLTGSFPGAAALFLLLAQVAFVTHDALASSRVAFAASLLTANALLSKTNMV